HTRFSRDWSSDVCSSDLKKDNLYEVDVPTVAIDSNQDRYNRIKPSDVKAKDGVFRMPGLNYQYTDLMPNMNPQTIEEHYAKIHLRFADNLNIAVKGTPMEAQSKIGRATCREEG